MFLFSLLHDICYSDDWIFKSVEHFYGFQPDYASCMTRCSRSTGLRSGKPMIIIDNADCNSVHTAFGLHFAATPGRNSRRLFSSSLVVLTAPCLVHCADQSTATPPQHRHNAAIAATKDWNPVQVQCLLENNIFH